MTEKKVLIVDFDDKSIDPLSKFLEEEGFSVKVARDGEEGLEAAKADQPDLVILEPMLPKLHGFELCGIITHDFEPKIPVIILTKFYREEQFKIESVRSFGASAFVSKPFEPSKMRDILTEVLPNGNAALSPSDEDSDNEIPDSIPADTLKDLQEDVPETPKKEEAKVPEPENLEKDILKSVKADEPKQPDDKPDRDFSQELDAMLQDTLSGFSLGGEEKKAAPEPSAQTSQPTTPEEDDILQKLDEIAQSSSKKIQTEAPQAAEIRFEAPQEVVQKAEEVTATLEKELESKVRELSGREPAAEKAEPTPEPAPEIKPESEAKPEPKPEAEPEAEPEPKPEPEAEIKPEPEVKLEAEAKPEPEVKPEAKQQAEPEPKPEPEPELKTEPEEELPVKEDKPNLRDVVEKEDMFSGFGKSDEDKSGPNFFTALIEKVKSAPIKYLIPLAAVLLVVIVSALFIFKPKKAGETPANQASFGVTTIGQVKPGTKEDRESTDPAGVPAENPNDPATLGEGNPEETGTPPQDDPAQQLEEQPAAKPEQKPRPKVTPPPNTPVLPQGMEQSEETAAPPEEGQPGSKAEGDPAEQPAAKPGSKAAAGDPPAEAANPPEKETPPPTKSTNPPVKSEETTPPPPEKAQPQKASQGDIVAIQQVDRQPEIIQQELPRFPGAAKGRGITGTVLINALISENGDVLQTVLLRKIKSPYNFNEEAERAVKRWKFRPAWKDGVRVKTWKVIPIAFKENMD
jgi:TonB family protein